MMLRVALFLLFAHLIHASDVSSGDESDESPKDYHFPVQKHDGSIVIRAVTDSSDEEAKQTMVSQLHRLLKPFMLRRLKKDFAKCIPPKKETLLYIGLSEMQRNLYRKVLERDMDTVAAVGGGKSNVKLLNILMQLRKSLLRS